MSPTALPPATKLTPMQISLLRVFEHGLMNDEQVLDLRRLIVRHLTRQMQEEVMRIDDERGYTADDYERMLNEPS